MRHLKKGRKFGRKTDIRRAFIKSLANALFLRRQIKTTEARAKELRPYVEKIITRAKNPNLNNRRYLQKTFSKIMVNKIFTEGELNKSRNGGYIRITKLGQRKSDGAKMAVISFVE